MPIYTRTGDKGKTSLFDGTRVFKSHIRVDSYGTIDELNSIIGVVIASIETRKLARTKSELQNIQHDLLDIGSGLAMPEGMPVLGLDRRINEFEKLVDKIMEEIPRINQFILPGGTKTASFLHLARTVARRAERRIVELSKNEKIDNNVITYINRLSDLFYAMARYANFKENISDVIWKKK